LNALETNRQLAAGILSILHEAGVRTLCVCPGGRNAPLVLAAEAAREYFDVVHFFEERSAAFFALGRIKRDASPVAVLTTSGTAAAELLPAMIEARYAGHPLIAVTADRPLRLRDTGAPQTIDHTSLFVAARAQAYDITSPDDLPALQHEHHPVHLNVCFDEPLTDGPVTMTLPPSRVSTSSPHRWLNAGEAKDVVDDFFRRVRHPLVIVSTLDPLEAHAVRSWLATIEAPLYLEGVSQLRNDPCLQEFSLKAGERILLTSACREACDGVLRIGGVPTPRFWRQAEDWPAVLHVSRVNLPGMAEHRVVVPPELFLTAAEGVELATSPRHDKLRELDTIVARETAALLAAEPHSEAALVHAFASRLEPDARILLGNSLSIREWDLLAPRIPDQRTLYANRGVNGIDGLVSTALGLAEQDRPTAALIGDLSALYDMVGLWPAAQLPASDITLGVVNNGGGMIFDRMFRDAAFLNRHTLRLRGWAEMFGWHYGVMHSPAEVCPSSSPRLVEILPDAQATSRWSDAYARLWEFNDSRSRKTH
jgi:2-succinyl-5-enolpyruvyl-6-hydroxy-3-cyclohexene-1-carboxylate synthase